ncbi:hypothetical protein MMC07_000056 [Pseudocyphellaria aurata]|nr:hypothetical protein [Pseudocyphellaria aurata]
MKFLLAAALVLAGSAAAYRCPCCAALSTKLGKKVVYPSSASYETSINSYWSGQAQLSPFCIVQPTGAEDVSQIVKTLVRTSKRSYPCRFAIRGGGHTPWAGSSNIQRGVTIDLSLMSKTTLNKDATAASIGPGSRWVNVYEVLDQLGVSVPGGRAGSVGVAGLTLGGGNSFFAARYGLVCDNVLNFEIVLADGRIVNANAKSNADLFQALKGGSNNFGIVTRFDLVAFKQGNIWGGVAVYPSSTTSQQLQAFVNFGNKIAKNPYGSIISIYQYSSTSDGISVTNAYEYTKPEANAPPFDEFLKIPNKIVDTLRVTNLTDLTAELEQAYGFRDSFSTITFKNDIRVLHKVIDIFNSKISLAKKRAVGQYSIVSLIQPIPTIFSKHSVERGGNVLGLDRAKDNLVLFLCDLSWKDAKDDQLFKEISSSTITEIGNYAKSIGADNEYIYLDYADKSQNPLRSYGSSNLRKIRNVAKKYDPTGVFQRLVPGGFKLAAAGPAYP